MGKWNVNREIERELVIHINRFKAHLFILVVLKSRVEYLVLSYPLSSPFGFSEKTEKRGGSCSFIISIYFRLDVQVVEHL